MRLEKEDFHNVLEYEGYLEAGKTCPHPTSSKPDYFLGWRIRDTERGGNTVMFEVTAGDWDKDTGEDVRKMRHFHPSAPHALQEYNDLQQMYDWVRLDLVVEQDKVETRWNVLGGCNKEQRVLLDLSYLWMVVMNEKFVDLQMDPQQQIEDILVAWQIRHAPKTPDSLLSKRDCTVLARHYGAEALTYSRCGDREAANEMFERSRSYDDLAKELS